MTPVQIPFKRNFKDMENKFEYLKIDGREQLPAPLERLPSLEGIRDGDRLPEWSRLPGRPCGTAGRLVGCRRSHGGGRFRWRFQPGT